MRFLDANMLLGYFTRDDERKFRRAQALLGRIERGEETVTTTLMIIFETVFVLDRVYRVPRTVIGQAVRVVVQLSGVRLSGKRLVLAALDLYATSPYKISFADAYTAVYMRSRGITVIYSWDTDFERIIGLTRVEPSEDDSAEDVDND
jgi:predicted nucleic acid-binding protein